MRHPSMLAELRIWSARRRMIAAGVAIVAFVGLVIASGVVTGRDGAQTASAVPSALVHDGTENGEVCATCRPLFPRSKSRS